METYVKWYCFLFRFENVVLNLLNLHVWVFPFYIITMHKTVYHNKRLYVMSPETYVLSFVRKQKNFMIRERFVVLFCATQVYEALVLKFFFISNLSFWKFLEKFPRNLHKNIEFFLKKNFTHYLDGDWLEMKW